MGATRGVLVTDPALAGSCAVSTARVLAAALRTSSTTSCSPASTRPTASAASFRPAIAAHARAAVPVDTRRGSSPTRPPARVRVRRISADRLRRARGADARPHRLHPGARRAALPVAQGDHGRPIEGDRDAVARRPRRSIRPRSAARSRRRPCSAPRRRRPAARPRSSGGRPPRARARIVEFLADAEAHLMGAHLGRRRAAPTAALPGSAPRSRRSPATLGAAAGREVVGIVVARGPGPRPPRSSPATCRVVWSVTDPAAADHAVVGDRRRAASPRSVGASGGAAATCILVGAGPDGRDVAGDAVGAHRAGRPRQRDWRRPGRTADRSSR